MMPEAKVLPLQDDSKSQSQAASVQQVDNISHALAGAGAGLISMALTHVI